ncbi:MAG: hypothetical protein QXL88_00155 [Candidatus Pacearchaeota archaeon]
MKFKIATPEEEAIVLLSLIKQRPYPELVLASKISISKKDYLKIKKSRRMLPIIKSLKSKNKNIEEIKLKIEKEWNLNKKILEKKLNKFGIKINNKIKVVLMPHIRYGLYNPDKGIIYVPFKCKISLILHELIHIWFWKNIQRFGIEKNKASWLVSEALASLISQEIGPKYKTDFCKEIAPYRKKLKALWKNKKLAFFIKNAYKELRSRSK